MGGFKEPKRSPFASGDSPIFLAHGDLNNDGKLDLAIANSPSNSTSSGKDGLTILLGDDKGNFKTMGGSPFATGAAPTRLAIGDVNGDRFSDVAVSNLNSNSISLFLMDGKGGILSTSTINAGKQPKGIVVQDLNGDGKVEIIVANYGDNNILVITGK